MSFAVFGVSFSIVGIALTDLQHITKVSLTTASLLITYQYGGHVTGSVLTGLMYCRINIHMYHVLTLIGLSATLFTIPWCTSFTTMAAGHTLIGLFGGAIDSVGVCEVMRIWGSTTDVPVNIMWFAYTAGCLAVFLIFIPFLTSESSGHNADDMWIKMTNGSVNGNNTNITSDTSDSYLVVPYTITTTLSFLLAIAIFIFYMDMYLRNGKIETPDEDDLSNDDRHLGLRIILIILTTMIFVFSCCADVSFHTFIPVYCLTWMKWSKGNALMSASIYRGSLLFGRFIAIFISARVSSGKLLTLASVLLSLLLIAFTLNGLLIMLDGLEFVLCVMYGLLLSPLNGSLINVAEQHVILIRGNYFAFLAICTCVSIGVNAPVIGYLMDNRSPMYFMYVLFVEITLLSVFSICLILLTRVPGKSYAKPTDLNENPNDNKTVQKLTESVLFELQKVTNNHQGYQKLE